MSSMVVNVATSEVTASWHERSTCILLTLWDPTAGYPVHQLCTCAPTAE